MPPLSRTFGPKGATATKSIAEILDFGIDWSSELASDETLVSSAWSVDDGELALFDDGLEGSVAFVWARIGRVGSFFTLTNTVSTGGGRVLLATIDLLVVA